MSSCSGRDLNLFGKLLYVFVIIFIRHEVFTVKSKAALLRISKSKTAARKIASEVAPRELDAAITNLKAAREFLVKQAAKNEQANRARKIKKAMSVLDQLGLKAEDLGKAKKTGSASQSSTKKKVPVKYRIEVNGVVTEWPGRGRLLFFREAAGKKGGLSRYLIK